MNKEAIERTKARCRKEIKGKDRIYVMPGFYVKKQKDISEWDATVDYADGTEVIWHDKTRVVSGLNKPPGINQKEAGVIVPRADYIPEINSWIPLSRQELYTLLGVAAGMIVIGVYFL